eukprot:2976664-Pleurochrysis_carterae.AAC.2
MRERERTDRAVLATARQTHTNGVRQASAVACAAVACASLRRRHWDDGEAHPVRPSKLGVEANALAVRVGDACGRRQETARRSAGN